MTLLKSVEARHAGAALIGAFAAAATYGDIITPPPSILPEQVEKALNDLARQNELNTIGKLVDLWAGDPRQYQYELSIISDKNGITEVRLRQADGKMCEHNHHITRQNNAYVSFDCGPVELDITKVGDKKPMHVVSVDFSDRSFMQDNFPDISETEISLERFRAAFDIASGCEIKHVPGAGNLEVSEIDCGPVVGSYLYEAAQILTKRASGSAADQAGKNTADNAASEAAAPTP